MLPVDTRSNPLKLSRPRHSWTRAPRFPRAQRPQRRDGVVDQGKRAAHVAPHPQRGRRERVTPPAPGLQLFVAEVAQGQQQGLAHPRPELLVGMEVGDLFAGVEDVVIRRDVVHALPVLRVDREQVDAAVLGALHQHDDLLLARLVARSDRHLPGRAVEPDHVGMHEGDAKPSARDADGPPDGQDRMGASHDAPPPAGRPAGARSTRSGRPAVPPRSRGPLPPAPGLPGTAGPAPRSARLRAARGRAAG